MMMKRSTWLWALFGALLVVGIGAMHHFGSLMHRGGGMMMGMHDRMQGGMHGGMMGGMCGGMMGMHGGGGHHFFGLLLLVGALAAGYCFWKRHHSQCRHHESDAMKLLQIRLVKGEITPEEYDTIKQKLQG